MSGTLYLVATPIGNLEDITVRALRILGEVRLIAAEDTRRTAKLLRHYGIATPTTSLHDHNEHERAPALVERLLSGISIALLSDAGTPIISDPGLLLVREALSAGISVVSLPGPSAPIAALISSGAPSSSFTFVGFPPRRSNDRIKWLKALADEPRTLIFFEAPHRLIATLTQIETVWGDRSVAICRELTKIHEESVIGPISSLLPTLSTPRGEYTCVVWPALTEINPALPVPPGPDLLEELGQITKTYGSRRDAIKEIARKYGMTARKMYTTIENAKLVLSFDINQPKPNYPS
jgi:16S rRNA (cytidine1402-2'-O)-methyltransferase